MEKQPATRPATRAATRPATRAAIEALTPNELGFAAKAAGCSGGALYQPSGCGQCPACHPTGYPLAFLATWTAARLTQ